MRELSVTEQRYKAVVAVIGEGRTVTEVARDWRLIQSREATLVTRAANWSPSTTCGVASSFQGWLAGLVTLGGPYRGERPASEALTFGLQNPITFFLAGVLNKM